MTLKNSPLRGLGLLVALTISISACGAPEEENGAIDSSNGVQQSESADSVAENGSLDESVVSGSEPTEAVSSPVTTSEDFVRVSLVEYAVSNEKCSYRDGSLKLRATLTNLTDKTIIAAEVSARINDVFGEEIGRGFDISSDETVGPGSEVNLGTWGNSCFSLSANIGDQKRLLDFQGDLNTKTTLVISVTRIAFDDGEIVEF